MFLHVVLTNAQAITIILEWTR